MPEHNGYPIVVALHGNAATRLLDKIRAMIGDWYMRDAVPA